MHELGIAMDVVDVVTERARGARVKRIVLEIGVLTAVLPDALRFCFDLATEGTPVAGASLEILESRRRRAAERAARSSSSRVLSAAVFAAVRTYGLSHGRRIPSIRDARWSDVRRLRLFRTRRGHAPRSRSS